METRQLSLRQIQPQVGPSQLMQTLNGPTRYAHLHPVILLRNRRMLAAPGKLCGQLAELFFALAARFFSLLGCSLGATLVGFFLQALT